MSNSTPHLTSRLSVMMFLQFFIWGAWFATLGQCLGSNNLSGFGGDAYGTAPLGAIFAPLFLGIIADRFFPSQKVMGFLFLIGAVFLLLIPSTAEAAAKLIEISGGSVAGFIFVINLFDLPGNDLLKKKSYFNRYFKL